MFIYNNLKIIKWPKFYLYTIFYDIYTHKFLYK